MADLRIVDAPEIPTNSITGQEKLPTGGNGNYAISLDSVANYTKTKKDLADNTSVDNKVNSVRQQLNAHTQNLSNPHQVTKGQISLGNVDNTADLDKPVSNPTQSAIISAVAPKADKTYVDNQLEFKADKTYVDNQIEFKANNLDAYAKSETYTKQESADLVDSNISTALNPINLDLDLAKRGVINTFNSNLSYNTNERVVLTGGGFVVSTINGNTNNPNIDMTGWFAPYLRGSQNLSELTDVAQARTKLDVYSKSEALAKGNNLSELTDKSVARANLGVYSKAETDNIAGTPIATESVAGKAKIATTATAQAGVNDTDIITPLKLKNSVFGIGQTVQNVTASRALNTTYTNSTNKPILISITVAGANDNKLTTITVDGVAAAGVGSSSQYGQVKNICYVIPPSSTYSVAGSPINIWTELR